MPYLLPSGLSARRMVFLCSRTGVGARSFSKPILHDHIVRDFNLPPLIRESLVPPAELVWRALFTAFVE